MTEKKDTRKNIEPFKFQKGQSGNPSGRPKTDPIIKKFKETTYKEFIETLQKYGTMTREEVNQDLKRPDATMFEVMFGNIVSQAAKGDKDARSLLIDRLWGKVKESIDLNFNQMSDEELVMLGRIAIQQLEEAKE